MGFNRSLAVGALIILLCFTVQIAAVQGIDINKFDPDKDLTLGQLQLSSGTVYFPWAKETGRPEKEEIQMSGSHPQQALDDLRAVNSVKERDVVYEGAQSGDADGQISGNSMDIRVSGKGQDNSHADEGDSSFGNGIEGIVDDALASSMQGSFAGGSSSTLGRRSSMNNMNIDVSGISASAINTAPGGSAVVNNNIIIKPVQVILVPTDSHVA